MRVSGPVVLASVLIVIMAGNCTACVGARPLAMGGAFTGLSDDVNATYWNPAGIALVKESQATFMYTATNRDEINYQSYTANAGRISGTDLAYGVSYISNHMNIGGAINEQSWYWLSLAYKARSGLCMGLNVRHKSNSIPGISTDLGMDVSVFKIIDEKWSFGLLVQDINEPDIRDDSYPNPYGGIVGTYGRNIRPGIAYRVDKDTVVTADIYDLMDHSNARALRLGGEKVLPNGLALRAGYYGAGSTGSLTFGAGGMIGKMQFDAAIMTGDLDNTVLLSATSKY